MTDRPTNVQLVAQFRALLTSGATDTFDKANFRIIETPEDLLTLTKPWRSALWNAFNEIEERLCPLEVETRRREKLNENHRRKD
jgi:hypothetical protein